MIVNIFEMLMKHLGGTQSFSGKNTVGSGKERVIRAADNSALRSRGMVWFVNKLKKQKTT